MSPSKPTVARGDANPRRLALVLMRDMKRLLADLVRTWDVPATVVEIKLERYTVQEQRHQPGFGTVGVKVARQRQVYTERARLPHECPENSPEEWLTLWNAAINLRDSADRLAAFCKQERDKIIGGQS